MQEETFVEDGVKLCECGCGYSVKIKQRYLKGHNRRGLPGPKIKGQWKHRSPPQLCECGCGEMTKVGNRFVYKHGCGREIGYHHTKETINKLSKPRSEVVRMNIKLAFNTPEIRLQRSLISKEVQNRPELREQQSKTHIVLMCDPKYRIKHKKACNTEEAKRHFSESSSRSWKNPEFVKKQMHSRNVAKNKQEEKLETVLNHLYPNEYKYVGDGEVIIAGKCPDFININGQKKIIELFGDYWHKGADPQEREKIFAPFGYQTLVIWEHELKNLIRVKFRIHRFHRREDRV